MTDTPPEIEQPSAPFTAGEADVPPVESPAAEFSAPEPVAGSEPNTSAAREPGLSPAQTAARLAELFPALFGGATLPIKLRIQADIQERAPGVFTKRVMSIVLSRHTTTTPYLKALLAQTQRFDLDGQPAGDIAAEHKQAAADELARRRAIVEERRAAERAARPPRPPRRMPHGASADGTPRTEPSASPDGAIASDVQAPRRDAPHRPDRSGAQNRSGQARHAQHREDRPRQPAHTRHGGGRTSDAGRFPPSDRAPSRGPRTSQPDRQGASPPRSHTAAQPEWTPVDPAQRERAVLLRTWEGSALTKANFCVLKRLSEAEFDAQISLARQERDNARRAN